MANKRIDVMGKKFGKLTVVAETDKRNKAKAPLYECICDCGNVVFRSATKLLVSDTPRCDQCIVAHNKGKTRLAKGESGRNSLYCRYRIHAEKRGKEFPLSKQQFQEVTSQNCYYCGAAPNKVAYGSHGFTKDHGAYLYNGIDRIDSNKGYTLENIVACCTKCNIMKMDIPIDEFLERVMMIANNLNLKRKDL